MPVIAFQGRPGAYSDLACRAACPGWETLPCHSFADAIRAVTEGRADEAFLPCENSLAGRVPEIHALIPKAGLAIVGEHFQRIEHCLVGVKGAALTDVKRVHTHPVALAQVQNFLRQQNLEGVAAFDTAGAAEQIAAWNDPAEAAVASSLAAELNGLTILQRNIEDAAHNTTRFYRVAREGRTPLENVPMMTTLMVRLKNAPGALYEVLGCFARNGVNMTRIESYMVDGSFTATKFLMDLEGRADEENLGKALEELAAVKAQARVLGIYPRSESRKKTEKTIVAAPGPESASADG